MQSILAAMLGLLAFAVTTDRAASADPFLELDLIRPSKLLAAPDFTAPRAGGGEVRLGEERGKVIFLNFWATWCPPCKEEMPSMERLYRRFKARKFTILAISIDTPNGGRVAKFARELGLTFPIGLDPGLEIANRYNLRGLPVSFLIDPSGRIAAIALGARDWDTRAAHAAIEAMLQ
ncbi:MAG: peroxiredoxin family protein [Candidatus Rokuibacteriota bacterium]